MTITVTCKCGETVHVEADPEPWNYPLFEHMSIEYSIDLLESEMTEIILIALECERRRLESLARLKEE